MQLQLSETVDTKKKKSDLIQKRERFGRCHTLNKVPVSVRSWCVTVVMVASN